MKKIFIGFFCGIALVVTVAAIKTQNNSILISGGFGGEPKYAASQNDQTAPWVNFTSNGVSVFQIPANGILPVANGGTGIGNGATIPVYVIFTGTNGVTYTNQIINGIVQ